MKKGIIFDLTNKNPNNMNPKISEQKRLMQQALKRLDDMDAVERLIKPMDPITNKLMQLELADQYITIMAQLQLNLLSFNLSLA